MAVAGGRPSPIDGYACVGVDFRSASTEVLSALQEPDPGAAATRLLEELGADEVAILQTCNRFEVYLYSRSRDPMAQAARLREIIGRRGGGGAFALAGFDAVVHLFRVASGLESMVVGEHEILGQVRDAAERAIEAGSAGPMLRMLFERAVRVGRRVRTETGVSRGSVSVARLAVDMISRRLGPGSRLLVIGAGHMGSLIASYLRDAGFSDITIANRTFGRAASLASRLGYRAVPLEDLRRALASADAAIVAVSSPSPVITEDMMPASDLLILDVSVPRAVERPSARPTVQVLTIDDLVDLAEDNRLRRMAEAERAASIVMEEAGRFEGQLMGAIADGVIRSLMERAERVRELELERALRILGMEDGRGVLDAMTKAIVNKVSAPIIEMLRELGRRGDAELLERLRGALEAGPREIGASSEGDRSPPGKPLNIVASPLRQEKVGTIAARFQPVQRTG